MLRSYGFDDSFFRPKFSRRPPSCDRFLAVRDRIERMKQVVLNCLARNRPDADACPLETVGKVVVFQSPPGNGLFVSIDTIEVAFVNREIASEDAVIS